MRLNVISFLLIFFPTANALAQNQADTAFIATAKRNAIASYEKEMRTQSGLYNGSKYVAPDYDRDLHPYFSSEDWITGSVHYDGEYFTDVSLMYDLYNAALIAEHFPSGHPIQLIEDKVQSFDIDGHHFQKIHNEVFGNSLPATGFYDVLHPGKTKLIARRQKVRRQEIEDLAVETFFDARTRYFVLKNDVFFPVKNKGSLLKILSDRKRRLKKFLKDNKALRLQHKEDLLKGIAAHYDSLE
jgi:hypothetical protein